MMKLKKHGRTERPKSIWISELMRVSFSLSFASICGNSDLSVFEMRCVLTQTQWKKKPIIDRKKISKNPKQILTDAMLNQVEYGDVKRKVMVATTQILKVNLISNVAILFIRWRSSQSDFEHFTKIKCIFMIDTEHRNAKKKQQPDKIFGCLFFVWHFIDINVNCEWYRPFKWIWIIFTSKIAFFYDLIATTWSWNEKPE